MRIQRLQKQLQPNFFYLIEPEMLSITLVASLTLISILALLINLIVISVIILSKQVSPSQILLLHLSIVESIICIVFLILSAPLIYEEIFNGTQIICYVSAFIVTLLHPVALWTVCGLNCDRYFAISAPLHYNSIVNSRRTIGGLVCCWLIVISAIIPPFFGVAPYCSYHDIGICLPQFSAQNSQWYAIYFTFLTLILPGFLIILCNIKIFTIARYHRHRIAAAIFEVTLSAQVTITHQRNPFPGITLETIPQNLRARNPMCSICQTVGSIILLYCPFYISILWDCMVSILKYNTKVENIKVAQFVAIIPLILIHISVFVNVLVYGLKNKTLRKTIQNYWRKRATTEAINNEIHARTPSTCGSRRPSFNSIFFNRSVSHQHLTDTYSNLSQTRSCDRAQMKHSASEITWKCMTSRGTLPMSASAQVLQVPSSDDHSSAFDQNISTIPFCNKDTRTLNSNLNIATTFFQKFLRPNCHNLNKNTDEFSFKSPEILVTNFQSDEFSNDGLNLESLTFETPTPLNTDENLFEITNHPNEGQTNDLTNIDLTDIIFESYKAITKRSQSLDEHFKCTESQIGDTEESLLLSWPTTRKNYKMSEDDRRNIPLFDDRIEQSGVLL